MTEEELKQKLVDSLSETARRIGSRRFFWELFVDELLAGRVEYLDPQAHIKKPKPLSHVIENLWKTIGDGTDFSKVSQETQLLLTRAVKQVLTDLNY